jgi:hypothetical protein
MARGTLPLVTTISFWNVLTTSRSTTCSTILPWRITYGAGVGRVEASSPTMLTLV